MTTHDPAVARPAVSPFGRLALEAGPLLVFFITNNQFGIMTGTAVFMVATLVSVVLSYRLERRLPLMPLVGCFFVMVFGGLTLALDDDLFIKLKPTVVNCLFAAILFVGLAVRRQLLKLLMGGVPWIYHAGRCERDRVAQLLHRLLGEFQGVRPVAAVPRVRRPAGAADHALSDRRRCGRERPGYSPISSRCGSGRG